MPMLQTMTTASSNPCIRNNDVVSDTGIAARCRHRLQHRHPALERLLETRDRPLSVRTLRATVAALLDDRRAGFDRPRARQSEICRALHRRVVLLRAVEAPRF